MAFIQNDRKDLKIYIVVRFNLSELLVEGDPPSANFVEQVIDKAILRWKVRPEYVVNSREMA